MPLIKEITIKNKGSAGPSGLDAEDWRQMCCSSKEASNKLCNTLARTTQRIVTTYVGPKGLEALNACRWCCIGMDVFHETGFIIS
jgi:hypothetical protein